MSNSKVRKQLEARSKNEKLLEAYKKKADLILNYQMCKAYYKDSGLSILAIVEKILKMKYNLPWQEKLIRKALNEARGKTNATITIPQFKYEKSLLKRTWIRWHERHLQGDCTHLHLSIW